MAEPGPDTRQRILEAAARLFAERGFRKVTVRDICRSAHANLAAVNYHFGDKFGLYREVVGMAIRVMQETNEAAWLAGGAGSAEERLRAFVRVFLERLTCRGTDTWLHRLMARELGDPTPALDAIVNRAVRPRFDYLCGLVGELLRRRPADDTVRNCAASIQAQFMLAIPHPIGDRLLPEIGRAPADIERLADHISNFSLAGIRGLRRRAPRATAGWRGRRAGVRRGRATA